MSDTKTRVYTVELEVVDDEGRTDDDDMSLVQGYLELLYNTGNVTQFYIKDCVDAVEEPKIPTYEETHRALTPTCERCADTGWYGTGSGEYVCWCPAGLKEAARVYPNFEVQK